MRTRAGLIELDCGWVIGVAAVAPGQVRAVLSFDPRRENFGFGVKDLRISADEAGELIDALVDARRRAVITGVRR